MGFELEIKTLDAGSFQLSVEPSALVSDVKQMIQELKGDKYEASRVQLIYTGKILANDTTLADANIDGTGFLVCMVKKKPVVSKPTELTQPAPAPAPAAAPAAPAESSSAPAPAPAPAPAATSAGGFEVDAAAAAQLQEMGFPRDQCEAALRAAFNDPEVAANYLMTGIPEGLGQEAEAAAMGGGYGDHYAPRGGGGEGGGAEAAAAAAAANLLPAGRGGEAEAEDEAAGGGGNPLGFLRFHPQFRQLQAVVRENPALLQEVLARVGEDSPELLGMIHEHPEAFTQLLNEAPAAGGGEAGGGGAGEGAAGAAAAQMLMQMMADGGEEGDDDMEGMETGGMMEGADVVELSAGEMEAVERLEALGFSKDACIEAFMACDKNEMLAANYLFENGGG